MKKLVALGLTFALLCFCAPARASAAKPAAAIFPLLIAAVENPQEQNEGRLFAEYREGVLVLSYDPQSRGQEAKLLFTFQSTEGAPVPRAGWVGILQTLREDRLLSPGQSGLSVESQAELSIQIDPRIGKLSLTMECSEGVYVVRDMPVIWIPLYATPAYRVSIWPSRDITIGVGQELELDIQSTSNTCDRRVTLAAGSHDTFVFFTSHSGIVRGLSEGTQPILVRNSAGESIDVIQVTVVKNPVEYESPQPPVPVGNYRVLARSLDVYRNADTAQPRLGALPTGTRVRALAIQDGWVLSDMGFWVEERYLAEVK